jgi:hypothetical protein
MRNLSEKYFPIIEEFLKSKQSVRAFCEQKGVNVHTFGYWKKKYHDRRQAAEKVKGFASLSVIPEGKEGTVTIQYGDGTRLIFDALPDTKALKQFLPVFEK